MLHWAHVYSRRYLALRWNPLNSLALCPKDHFWWHDHPLDAARWALEAGIDQAKLSSLLQENKRPDFEETRKWLIDQLATYGITVPSA